MSAALDTDLQSLSEGELFKRGVTLLSQQTWCWGRDILREEGNWLVETGFERIEAPADRENCSSVYSRELAGGRRVVLRGFGVFYGDDRLGGVFLPRYQFRPRFTTQPRLECPPWTDADLPALGPPDDSQRAAWTTLSLDLIEWVRGYEATVAERLGISYRQATLDSWTNTKQPILPATQVVAAWRSLGDAFAETFAELVPPR